MLKDTKEQRRRRRRRMPLNSNILTHPRTNDAEVSCRMTHKQISNEPLVVFRANKLDQARTDTREKTHASRHKRKRKATNQKSARQQTKPRTGNRDGGGK